MKKILLVMMLALPMALAAQNCPDKKDPSLMHKKL